MSQPLVSIIIPAYNADRLIAETLNFIKSQTHSNWELIVVEDGSHDKTESIVKDFANGLKQPVHYLRHPSNQGIPATRNTAMRIVRGSYIALLDADDLWKENHLELAVKALEEGKGDFIFSTVQVFHDATRENLGLYGPSPKHLEDFPNSLFSEMNFIQPSAVVMRREITDKVGYFDVGLAAAEDSDYFLRIAAAGFKILHIDTITCLFRRGHTSMTSNMSKIREYYALVLRKHRNLQIIPRKIRREAAMIAHLSVAKENLRINPIKSIEFFFWAWRFKPTKIKYIAGILIAFVFSLLFPLRNLISNGQRTT